MKCIIGFLAAAAAAAFVFAACSQPRPAATATPAEPNTALPGSWYELDGGQPQAVDGPGAKAVAYQPWTTQTRVAGFIELDGTVYIALNGWGLLEMDHPEADAPAFRRSVDRSLFAGRSINGLFASGHSVLIHIYQNILFDTPAPAPGPAAIALFDPRSGNLSASVLPLTKAGWEAVDVVHRSDGKWSIALKHSAAGVVDFRYALYSPATGSQQYVTRNAFLASYDFQDIRTAPAALRDIDAALRALTPSHSQNEPVVHYLLKQEGYSSVVYYRSGSEQKLVSGDADLLSIPVVRNDTGYYALAPDGRILVAGAERSIAGQSVGGSFHALPRVASIELPVLPAGFAYTDFWSDGVTLVVSWEQQRFPNVGAAGLYLRTIAPFVAAGAP